MLFYSFYTIYPVLQPHLHWFLSAHWLLTYVDEPWILWLPASPKQVDLPAPLPTAGPISLALPVVLSAPPGSLILLAPPLTAITLPSIALRLFTPTPSAGSTLVPSHMGSVSVLSSILMYWPAGAPGHSWWAG
ncbi:hypothetical protein ROHU_009175 [Labeo rohita]|uniref:Uncharacterized protein n=1 Tax=Labeo rohita TaxID=84645 RepID=A0A498M4R7_LABRO|nr:hypothetical protein ROHU_009175 [Labeo rohita]